MPTLWPSLTARIPFLPKAGFFVVAPELRYTYNSELPYSLNDGPMWAGRGSTATISGGAGIQRTIRGLSVRAVIAPTVDITRNKPFVISPTAISGWSPFASRFHTPGQSMDLPARFGDRGLSRVDAGRSGIHVASSSLAFGVTADNEVWGPGIRNALIMSANAPGIPRLYFENRKPWRTRLGDFTARLVAGTLTESLYFDSDSTNDLRSLSGALFTLRTRFDTSLTLGVARVVYAGHAKAVAGALSSAFDWLTHWEYIARDTDTLPDGRLDQSDDQLLSVFARWVFPTAGFEVYGEWAHMDLPRNVAEVLTTGHHSAAYTIGFQWAQPRRSRDVLRLQSEFTYLEQSRVFVDRPLLDFYVGRVTPQGYTQRGQSIGAAIGPGGSSQFVAVDYLAFKWQGGIHLGRIRWENDAMYREHAPNFFRHDVSVLGGLRGGVRTPLTDLGADVTFAYRYNYLFQYGGANPGLLRTVDMRNLTIALTATPR